MPIPDAFFAPTFDRLPSELRSAITDAPLSSLRAGPQTPALATLLIRPADLLRSASDGGTAPISSLALSGLWLLAGELDRSHTISQDDSTPAGSFWHGIMHRREADYSNAAYWFRRVGSHPVFDDLAGKFPHDYRDPFQFVDSVAAACKTQDAERIAVLQQIQWIEWQLLLQDCMLA